MDAFLKTRFAPKATTLTFPSPSIVDNFFFLPFAK